MITLYHRLHSIWSIRGPNHHLQGRCLKFHDKESAIKYLSQFLHQPMDMMRLRNLLAEDSLNIRQMNDYEVLEHLAWRLLNGSVKIIQDTAVVSHAAPSLRTEIEKGEEVVETPTPSPAESPKATPHWVKFQIIDDETSQPFSNVTLSVKLPDGTVKEYTTGSDGLIQIENISSGTCDIQKVTDAESFEVVSIE